jgi:hypothetical protein
MGGFEESELTSGAVQKMLTPTQDALIADAFGLLNGIAYGIVTSGQPRIRDNLIQVVKLIPEGTDPTTVVKFMHFVRTTLSKASAGGLTAENQSFTPIQQNRSR